MVDTVVCATTPSTDNRDWYCVPIVAVEGNGDNVQVAAVPWEDATWTGVSAQKELESFFSTEDDEPNSLPLIVIVTPPSAGQSINAGPCCVQAVEVNEVIVAIPLISFGMIGYNYQLLVELMIILLVKQHQLQIRD